MKKNTVSLCLIVKNEEKCLARCLESFKGVADEICIIDTGSTDSTVSIAKKYDAKIDFFEWNNNFSDARNASLALATKEWVIVVDADEYLRQEDKTVLLNALKRVEFDGFLIKTLNFNQEGTNNHIVNLNQRIFKNNGNFKYEGRIHEQVKYINAGLKVGGFATIDVGFFHTGYLRTEREEKQKNKRNLEILSAAANEEPESMFSLFNLANELSNDPTKKEEVLDLYNRAYEYRDFTAGFAPKLVMFRLLAMIRSNKFDEALEAVADGLTIYPEFTDLVYQRGIIEKKKGLILKAIKSFENAIAMGKPKATLEFSKQSYGFGPYYYLGEIYEEQEIYDLAFNNYKKSLESDKTQYQLLSRMFDCLDKLAYSRNEIALAIGKFFNLNDDLNRVVYINILLEKLYHDEALSFLESTGTWESEHLRQKLLQRAKKII